MPSNSAQTRMRMRRGMEQMKRQGEVVHIARAIYDRGERDRVHDYLLDELGRALESLDEISLSPATPANMVCPTCAGTGNDENRELCPRCFGTRYIRSATVPDGSRAAIQPDDPQGDAGESGPTQEAS